MITYALLGSCYYFNMKRPVVRVTVLTAIVIYAMTLAPVTKVMLAELFPNRIRGTAMSLCVSTLWIACFLLTVTFKPINVALGAAGIFWLYGTVCVVGSVAMWCHLTETKGKRLELIELELADWRAGPSFDTGSPDPV